MGRRFDRRQYHDYATRAEVQAAGQVAAASQFGFDHVSVISDPCCEAADLGAAIFYPPDAPPAIIEERALLADPATLGRLRVPDPHRSGSRMANRIEAVRLLRRQVGATHLVEGWVEGPCAESADLRGINTLMMDFYDDPDFIHALAEFTVKVALKFATAQIEAGADIIGVGDAAASLIGRELYDEFVLPHEHRLVDGIHAAGGRVRLHICGRTQQLTDALAKLGCEIVDLDTMVDLRAARAAMGGRQVLLGNVHTVNVVRNGTPATCARPWQHAAPRPGRRGLPARAAKCPGIRRRKTSAVFLNAAGARVGNPRQRRQSERF